MSIQTFLLLWASGLALTVGVYWLAVTGRLHCAAMFCGHAWAVLKEEVMRPVRVIKRALSRGVHLDEHERHLS